MCEKTNMSDFPSKEQQEIRDLSNQYLNHRIFGDIEKYADFYDLISMSTFSFPTMGTTSIVNIDTYLYSSVRSTLKSISEILKKGRINDAYTLLRKYHDSAIINIYTNLYLQRNHSIENFIVEKINNWLHGKEQLPDYRIMHNYIINSNELSPIYKLLTKDGRYKEIRNRCNDNTHYNFYKNIMLNLADVRVTNRDEVLEQFSMDIKDLFILHISYLFYLNDHYMVSSDYVDHLDMGMQPVEGSQYYVAPFIQEIFDEPLKKNRPDIAREIQEHTSMELV